MTTVWAVIRDGRIVPIDEIPLLEGSRVLVTVMPEADDSAFWQGVDQDALASVWDNEGDDVYARLLEG